MAWLTKQQIEAMGFGAVGDNVLLSDRASFYQCEKIYLGNRVRIDDFCVLSAGEGGIVIGSYIHIAVFSSLIGRGKITLHDFCNLSSRVSVYSSNDDYSGDSLTNPMIPEQYKQMTHADVEIGKHVIVGSGALILPGVTLAEGVAVGAFSLVKDNVDAFTVVVGVPAKKISKRSTVLLTVEQQFLNDGKNHE